MIQITYEQLLEKLAHVCVERTFRHNTVIGLGNSKPYDEALYDNKELLGDVVATLFPDQWNEADLFHKIREAELKGVLVQISRQSVGEIPSGILSDPETPKKPLELLGREENYLLRKVNG